MSTTLTTIIAFVIVLSLLVFVHEAGHFTMAKLFGVRVFEFAIGFPPRLAAWTRGDTTYAINVVPLGGYVRMMGENGGDDENPESFGYKPWWQRGLILLGGPTMNVALAIILFFITLAWLGLPVATNGIGAVAKGSPAQAAGLRHGDTIVRIDGATVTDLNQIHTLIDDRLAQFPKRATVPVTMVVRRGGKLITVRLDARRNPPPNQGAVGVVMGERDQTYPVPDALGRAFGQIGQTVMVIPNLVGSLAHGRNPGVSGPVGIARYTGQAAMGARQFGLGELFGFVALISASLGVFNLLPIPALDGGRILFVLLSAVRRRSFDPQVEGAIHLVGMAVLILLVLAVSYQDIANWVSGQ